MIEINLLPGQKRKAAGGGFKLSVPNVRALLAQVKDPWLLGAVGAWVIVLAGGGFLYLRDSRAQAKAETRLDSVTADKRRYDAVIADKRKLERVRDTLLTEINVIRGIDGERYVWPHILDQISKALPPYTWLTQVVVGKAPTPSGPAPRGQPQPATIDTSMAGLRVALSGRTVDIQAYTTFLRQLAASPWFTDVTAANSETVVEQDRPVTAFDVTLRYRTADSVYIRTVPLIQSVR